jgi:general secretion pathway protein F
MPVYEYTAASADGKRETGVMTAESPRAARRELRLRQLSPLDIRETSEKRASRIPGLSRGARLRHSDLVLATRQLAMLVHAGSTVEDALGAIAREAENPRARTVLLGVREAITQGFSLNEAFAKAPRAFPEFYRATLASGQATGRLGEVLERLALHLEKSQKLQRKVMSALIYPMVLSAVALIVVSLLMVFVVPQVVEQFDTLGASLPPLTKAVIAVSDFVRNFGILIPPAVFGAVLVFRGMLKAPPAKRAYDAFWLRMPLVGRLIRNLNSARFARTFATLVGSGATVPEGLGAASRATRNAVFSDAAANVRRQVEEGQSLSRALRGAGVYTPMLLHMAASGERGGDLSAMLTRSADYLEDEFEGNTAVALGLMEPLLIVFLAVIVALIVLSIMLPILQINTLAIGG